MDLSKKSGVFSVSVLSKRAPLNFIGNFGFKSGRDVDKFEEVNYRVGQTGAPIVTDYAVAYIDVEVTNEIDVGSHTLFVGKVVDAEVLTEGEPMTYNFYHRKKRGITPEAVAEEIESFQGVEAELRDHVNAKDLANFDGIIVGAPTYDHGITKTITRVFKEASAKKVNLKGKIGAAFGSYGWSAEAPPLVLEIMNNKFRMDTLESPLLVKYAPDQSDLQECRQFGKKIAEKLRTGA